MGLEGRELESVLNKVFYYEIRAVWGKFANFNIINFWEILNKMTLRLKFNKKKLR